MIQKNILALILSLFAGHLLFAQENETVMTGTQVQDIAGEKRFNGGIAATSSGTQGAPMRATSSSGAAAGVFWQTNFWDKPVLIVYRNGDGSVLSQTPVMHVAAGNETPIAQPVMMIGSWVYNLGPGAWARFFKDGSASFDGSVKAPTLIVTGSANFPAAPSKGQIHFSLSDNHFYGWNGSSWKQLDN